MFKFITDRPFWVNALAALILFVLLIFLTLQMLGWITRHGQYMTVPSVIGKDTKKSIQLLESKGFTVNIVDSVYTDTLAAGTIIKQLPDPNSTVKVNRGIFITVNRYIPPLITMPSLEGKSLSYALDLLERNHLKLGDTVFKPDFMKGSILEQQYNGAKIPAGTKIPWGSKISFFVASGLDDREILVPDLIGKTYGDAKAILTENLITTGAIILDEGVVDTNAAFIYRQNPENLDEAKKPRYIRSGQLMDIWVSKEMKYPKDSTKTEYILASEKNPK